MRSKPIRQRPLFFSQRRVGVRRRLSAASWLVVLSCAGIPATSAQAQIPAPLQSGIEFSGADVRAQQADDFANPGMLWAVRGEKLWAEPPGSGGKACAGCHGDARASMKGMAARYPRLDPGAAGLVNIEGRINLCRARHQSQAPLAYESDELLGLTAYVAVQSRGTPVDVSIEPRNRGNFERGRDFYHLRQGQLNLACAQCHDQNWGRKLGAETISQGHGNAYPIYRLEWQTMGSLHRRLRSCLFAVGAEMLPQGAPELLDLELYLAWRASGLAIETPGVRR